jgi:hypothetical protein
MAAFLQTERQDEGRCRKLIDDDHLDADILAHLSTGAHRFGIMLNAMI